MVLCIAAITKMRSNTMLSINTKNNMCKTAVKYKQRSSGTKQLSFNFITHTTSHNIYGVRLGKSAVLLSNFDKPVRTVRFNKTGCSNILTIPLNNLKSYYKEGMQTFIELLGQEDPIEVRESIDEINNIINKE